MTREGVFTLQGECWGEWGGESPGRSAWTGGACYLTPGAGAGVSQSQMSFNPSEVSCYLTPGAGVPQSQMSFNPSEVSCYLTPGAGVPREAGELVYSRCRRGALARGSSRRLGGRFAGGARAPG